MLKLISKQAVSMEGPVAQVSETAAGFFYASLILPTRDSKKCFQKYLIFLTIKTKRKQRQGRFAMPISRLVVEM